MTWWTVFAHQGEPSAKACRSWTFADDSTAEDIEGIEEFTANFPNGYVMDIKWDDANEFDRYPSIGKLPCRTIKVDFFTDSKD